LAETADDPVASWQDRIASLRKRGRVSAGALAVVPLEEDVDVRRGRPPAPERLSDEERALWDNLTFSRRPGWFAGAETLLESFVVTSIQCQHIETALRATPITDAGYSKLARLHRATVALAATLGTRLRLTPHSHIHKTQPTDGDLPVA